MIRQHIDNDTLGLFVRTTALSDDVIADGSSMDNDVYGKVLDHLASCEECRDQVAIISTLQEEWCQLRHRSSLTDNQQQMICDYIDGRLPADDAEKAKALINEQPDAMKAALHYQSHVTSKEVRLVREAGDSRIESVDSENHPVAHRQNTYFPDMLSSVNRLFTMRAPMVYTMTATAALFIALVFLAQSPELQREQTMIASYQDNPTIKFTASNKLPGVGFFTQSGSTSKPFEDIRIELISENTIKISWPEVEGAELYKMRIQVFNQGKKTTLKERSTQTNHTTFLLDPEPARQDSGPGRRYEWVLYGNTADDRMFYASGGFVISKTGAESEADNAWNYDSW